MDQTNNVNFQALYTRRTAYANGKCVPNLGALVILGLHGIKCLTQH